MKKENKTADGKRVSNQKHEIAYVAKKAGIKAKDVRQAKKDAHSTSRKKIEKQIEDEFSKSED